MSAQASALREGSTTPVPFWFKTGRTTRRLDVCGRRGRVWFDGVGPRPWVADCVGRPTGRQRFISEREAWRWLRLQFFRRTA